MMVSVQFLDMSLYLFLHDKSIFGTLISLLIRSHCVVLLRASESQWLTLAGLMFGQTVAAHDAWCGKTAVRGCIVHLAFYLMYQALKYLNRRM